MRARALLLLLSAAVALVAPSAASAQSVSLSNAQFRGLTTIAVSTSAALDGITAADVTITRPGGGTIPARAVRAEPGQLVVDLAADAFARTTSEGTTIATRAFGGHPASTPVPVARRGEPAANAHILGGSNWTDEGWDTLLAEPQNGFYSFQDTTPNADASGAPLVWNNGAVTTPAHRDLRILVLFVQFPDRLAASSPAGWQTIQPYMDFLQPAASFWNTTSYGQLNVKLESPQLTRDLGWVMMDKNASAYPWGSSARDMFTYAREAFQKIYDAHDVKADDYDQVVIIPARGSSGLANGPANINSGSNVAYVDHDGKNHYVSTVLTAGNDMFSWGYRWMLHEWGHSAGFPDLYIYSPTNVLNTRVNQFFWVGGWDLMGNIGGHSGEYSAWHKYKLRWIRDDQVDVVSQPGTTEHAITPVETPGGTKMVVVRTGLTTAYVAEFRTKLGTNALDARGRYQGALLYRIDTGHRQQFDTTPVVQVISKQYYNDPAIGGAQNLNGVFRPISTSLSGLDTQTALWDPGDVFEDPQTGVRIDFGAVTNRLASAPQNSPYTADDVASLSVTKTKAAQLEVPVALSNAVLLNPTTLRVDTSVQLQRRQADNSGATVTRRNTQVKATDIVLTRGDGSAIDPAAITRVTIRATNIELQLAAGTFPTAASAAGLTVKTKPFYSFAAAAAPAPVEVHLGDVGGAVPATLSLTMGAPATFGAFTPGVAKDYTASTTATVISTAGDAALTVSDTSATAPGHLVNGAFSLPSPLLAGGLPLPATVKTYGGPVSNDAVPVAFTQHIGAGDALRTGTYAKTLTFTLSTTAP